jgi:hypothetical protein
LEYATPLFLSISLARIATTPPSAQDCLHIACP